MSKYYAYIFVRQDISAEQQIVQSAHVTHKMGASAFGLLVETPTGSMSQKIKNDPSQTYFTVVGVSSEEAIEGVALLLTKLGLGFVTFHEPDMNDEMTAIAVYPILDSQRGALMAFNRLKISDTKKQH